MPRSSQTDMDCSVAHTVALIGERWTLLVLRNAFHGMRTFEAFEENLGISTSVLSSRLKKLTDAGVLSRTPSSVDGRSFEYRLTRKGLDLYPVFVSLMQWGDQWAPNGKGRRLELREKSTGKRISGVRVLSADMEPLEAWDVEVRPGPGADSLTRELITFRDRRDPSAD